MNSALSTNCTSCSPQRKLNVRPQIVTSPRRHHNPYVASSEGHMWITKTLHQLHCSAKGRAAPMASPNHSTLCSICRIPSANPYYRSCSGPKRPVYRRSRPGSRCYSVAPAIQTSRGGTGNGSPGGNGSNGGGGHGDGSSNPSGSNGRHHESLLTETQQIKGLEDILLLDVQGQQLLQQDLSWVAFLFGLKPESV